MHGLLEMLIITTTGLSGVRRCRPALTRIRTIGSRQQGRFDGHDFANIQILMSND